MSHSLEWFTGSRIPTCRSNRKRIKSPKNCPRVKTKKRLTEARRLKRNGYMKNYMRRYREKKRQSPTSSRPRGRPRKNSPRATSRDTSSDTRPPPPPTNTNDSAKDTQSNSKKDAQTTPSPPIDVSTSDPDSDPAIHNPTSPDTTDNDSSFNSSIDNSETESDTDTDDCESHRSRLENSSHSPTVPIDVHLPTRKRKPASTTSYRHQRKKHKENPQTVPRSIHISQHSSSPSILPFTPTSSPGSSRPQPTPRNHTPRNHIPMGSPTNFMSPQRLPMTPPIPQLSHNSTAAFCPPPTITFNPDATGNGSVRLSCANIFSETTQIYTTGTSAAIGMVNFSSVGKNGAFLGMDPSGVPFVSKAVDLSTIAPQRNNSVLNANEFFDRECGPDNLGFLLQGNTWPTDRHNFDTPESRIDMNPRATFSHSQTSISSETFTQHHEDGELLFDIPFVTEDECQQFAEHALDASLASPQAPFDDVVFRNDDCSTGAATMAMLSVAGAASVLSAVGGTSNSQGICGGLNEAGLCIAAGGAVAQNTNLNGNGGVLLANDGVSNQQIESGNTYSKRVKPLNSNRTMSRSSAEKLFSKYHKDNPLSRHQWYARGIKAGTTPTRLGTELARVLDKKNSYARRYVAKARSRANDERYAINKKKARKSRRKSENLNVEAPFPNGSPLQNRLQMGALMCLSTLADQKSRKPSRKAVYTKAAVAMRLL